MATITPTKSPLNTSDGRALVWTWASMANGDTGAPVEWGQYADRSIQFDGTFGTGGTIKWQVSNDGTNWFDATDPQGNAISKTAAALEQVAEATRWARPNVTAGDGTTALNARLFLLKS